MRRPTSAWLVSPAVLSAVVVLLAGGGYALANRGGGSTIDACIHKGSRTLYVGKCKRGDKALAWNQTGPAGQAGTNGGTGPPGDPGPQGPSGVVTMMQFDASFHSLVTGNNWSFISGLPQLPFTDSKTAAEVTGTVTFGSTNNSQASLIFGVCYEPLGGSTITNVSNVVANLPGAGIPVNNFPVSISGVVSGLSPGIYLVGLCARAEGANVQNGTGNGTVILAETQ